MNTVVYVHAPSGGVPFFGVVVDYRSDRKWNRYRIVETDWRGAHPRGPAKWRDSTEFTSTMRANKTVGRIYRKNLLAEHHRGCDCNCCEHMNGYHDEE